MAEWEDLRPRVVSGLVMMIVGLAAILAGGVWFSILVMCVTAVILWECWTMIQADDAVSGMLVAVVSASILSALVYSGKGGVAAAILFLVVPLGGALALPRERVLFFLYALAILIAGYGLVQFRTVFGLSWFLWLVGVVVVTDIAGYFVGKTYGGPKFWPAISPKKTWSGTIGGWIGAAFVGLLFVVLASAPWWVIPLSILVSFAGQMGDIAESALKRRQGVKDSSALIPGHGGLFDRFDALMGAALFLMVLVWTYGALV